MPLGIMCIDFDWGLRLHDLYILQGRVLMHISCVLFASNGSPMYKSLTKTKYTQELETHEILKRVTPANAILKHYKSSSLMAV